MSVSTVLSTLPTGKCWGRYASIHKDRLDRFDGDAASYVTPPGDLSWLDRVQGGLAVYRNYKMECCPTLDGLPQPYSTRVCETTNSRIKMALAEADMTVVAVLPSDPDRNCLEKITEGVPLSFRDQPATGGTARLWNTGCDVLAQNDTVGLFYFSKWDYQQAALYQGTPNPCCPLATRRITPDIEHLYGVQQFAGLRNRFLSVDADTSAEFVLLAKVGVLVSRGFPMSNVAQLIERVSGMPPHPAASARSNQPPEHKRRRLADQCISDGRYTDLETNTDAYRQHAVDRDAYTSMMGGSGVIELTGDSGLTVGQQRGLNFMTALANNQIVTDYQSFAESRQEVAGAHEDIYSRMADACRRHCSDESNMLVNLFSTFGNPENVRRQSQRCVCGVDEAEKVIRDTGSLADFESKFDDKFEMIDIQDDIGFCIPHALNLKIYETMLKTSALDANDVGKIMLVARGDQYLEHEINKLPSMYEYGIHPMHTLGTVAAGEDATGYNTSNPGTMFQIECRQGPIKANDFSLPNVHTLFQ